MRDFEWYKEEGFISCPFCESTDIVESPGSLISHGEECANVVVCKNCQNEWHEVFQMVGIERIS